MWEGRCGGGQGVPGGACETGQVHEVRETEARGQVFRLGIRIEELAHEKSRARKPQERRSPRGWTLSTPGFEALRPFPLAAGSVICSTIDVRIRPE